MAKKDVLVLFSYRSHKYGYIEALFERLHKAASDRPLNLFRGSLSDSHIFIKNSKLTITETLTGRDIASFDAVYLELWYKAQQQALAVATYARRHGVPFFSEELESFPAMTKVGEAALLADQGIPLPDTFISNRRELKKVFKSAPPLPYPLVVKAADAYGGKSNYLVKDHAELKNVLDTNKGLQFIVQAFIPNDCDYRCLVFDGNVKLVLRRSREAGNGSHLNNTSQGATGEVVPVGSLPKAALHDAVKAAQFLKRGTFAGVDLIIDSQTGQHYILEVNQTPQIEIGAATDQKMAALLDYIEQRAGEKNG